jgi:hypothetical protein
VADLAAHEYRAWLSGTDSIPALWNLQWYGGHHVPGYSLLFPPLASLIGAPAAVALCGVAAAAALARLAREHPAAAWLLAAGAAANMVIGRGPFLMGIALAALALQWPRDSWHARFAALLTAAASPVAALFLCLIALADRRFKLVVGPAALVLALAVFFPEGGAERFVATAFWPMLALTVAAARLLPGRWRIGAIAYALALCAAFLIDTPMGHNAVRLGVLAGPAALAVAGRGPRPVLIAVGAGLLYLSVLPAVRAVVESQGDPAAEAAFHAPLLEFLDGAAAPGDRVEVVFTRNHWEAFHVAKRWPLARGWERQLDLKYNALFYKGSDPFCRIKIKSLTCQKGSDPFVVAFERWLRREGVRWVALPEAPLDFSAREEAALLRRGAPFLRPALTAPGWRVWELRDAPPPVEGPGRIVSTGPQRIVLHADGAGTLRLRYRWTRYWTVTRGRARLGERDGRLDVRALGPGAIELDSSNTPG